MKRVLVTGSAGFIGSNLCKELTSLGFGVTTWEHNEIDTQKIEFQVAQKIEKVQPNVVFHAGASADTLQKNVEYMFLFNYEFTKYLARESGKKNIPLIYSSSAANYGINGKYPSNLYGWSKYVAEDYVLAMGGLALRYFNVYGPGEERKGNMASFAYQAFTNRKSGKSVNIFPGEPKRDFVYIDDVVAANIHAFEFFDSGKGRYFEVGSGSANKFETLLELMQIKYGYELKENIPQGYQFYTCSDPKRWLPNWKPKYDIERGISAYLKYLKSTLS
jgi:ADP-L-glycero-D-manno-heptose 6-epimerase